MARAVKVLVVEDDLAERGVWHRRPQLLLARRQQLRLPLEVEVVRRVLLRRYPLHRRLDAGLLRLQHRDCFGQLKNGRLDSFNAVQRIAQTYMKPGNRVRGVYHPTGGQEVPA